MEEILAVRVTFSLVVEWGGHEWLDGWDATETARADLALARRILGAASRTAG